MNGIGANGIGAAFVAGLAVALAGCASTAAPRPGPAIQIPVFVADDARVGKAGFVAETLRLHKEQGAARYTLMAFRVGETWTLGAMVRGDFRGQVRWQVGAKALAVPFSTQKPAAEVAVVVTPATSEPVVAQGASFRGTAWTNIDLPAPWLADGMPLQLQFVAEEGTVVTLPEAGVSYTVHQVAR